ncbi:MAG TPA: glycosyl transferase [Gammaproteobacteria bacterium]|jgi:rSAM/selenodomain-associated transferase 2|nr:glycosyltransferase family 2 protein [Pseudomonadota bacterium]HAY46804.1 glycosyl transferase [Gammaproteobacteria bacterium]
MAALLGKVLVAGARWTNVISVVIPVLREAENISTLRQSTQTFRTLGAEVIIVDGGSDDGTLDLVRSLADQLVHAPTGRAKQMNAGAEVASGQILLFLHADTFLSEEVFRESFDEIWGSQWGRFDIRIDSSKYLYRVIEFLINLRSRLSGIATGDQAIFVKKTLFTDMGGFADIPLMEDVEICRRLKAKVRPVCLNQKVVTSARYWERNGPFRTIFRMWGIRFAYWIGVSPEYLVERYYR